MRVTQKNDSTLELANLDPSKTTELLSIAVFNIFGIFFLLPIFNGFTLGRLLYFGPFALMLFYFGSGSLLHKERIRINCGKGWLQRNERWLFSRSSCGFPLSSVKSVVIAVSKEQIGSRGLRPFFTMFFEIHLLSRRKSKFLWIGSYEVKRNAYDAAAKIAEYTGWQERRMKLDEISESRWVDWDDVKSVHGDSKAPT